MTGKKSIEPRVGVALMVVKEGRILLVRRKNSHGAGSWSTPGGHLEFGETPELCAARETLEETGITVRNIRFIAITNDIFREFNRHYVTIWMRAEPVSGIAHVADPDESDDCGWFRVDDLPRPLFLPFRHLLKGDSHPKNAFDSL
jgi:8-oxo-dGTP diphosphatase